MGGAMPSFLYGWWDDGWIMVLDDGDDWWMVVG